MLGPVPARYFLSIISQQSCKGGVILILKKKNWRLRELSALTRLTQKSGRAWTETQTQGPSLSPCLLCTTPENALQNFTHFSNGNLLCYYDTLKCFK